MEKLTKREMKEQRKIERIEEASNQKKMSLLKQISTWLGVIAIIIFSVVVLIKLSNSSPSDNNQTSPKAATVSKTDITNGVKNPKATLIEYSDFQCPACAFYHDMVKKLDNDYKGKLLITYRFYPLTQAHKNSMIAAQAAYASYLQGKFWEMNDLLFTKQTDWSENDNANTIFLSYAKNLNLNTEKFQSDENNQSTKDFINKEVDEGNSIQIVQTPTFYLNGNKLENPKSYEDFKALINEAIK